MNENPTTNRLSAEELEEVREMGSGEISAMTFQVGSRIMTSEEYVAYQAEREAEKQENIKAFEESLAADAEDRRVMGPMSFEERQAYIKERTEQMRKDGTLSSWHVG